MEQENKLLFSNLYINKVSLTKEIPRGNYLKNLSVVKSLKGLMRVTVKNLLPHKFGLYN